MTDFGLGITTFRDKKKENVGKQALSVYMAVKRGDIFRASVEVNKIVRDSVDWEHVTKYQGYPALGTYEAREEPAAHVYFSTPKGLPIKLRSELKRFKDKTNQDGFFLYEFVQNGGVPVLEITVNSVRDISKIQAGIIKATNGLIGRYLIYIYSLRRIVIFNVKEFDGLTATTFREFIPTVKRVVKPYTGKIIVKQVKVTVI